MLIANSREEVEARINAFGQRAERSLDSMKKELKNLNKNELINVMVAVIGYGAIYDNENVNKVIVKEAEIGAFNTLVKVEMDKINMIIETLTLEAMSRNTEEGNNESQEQQQE
jgi:hypothetical protein